MIPILDPNDPRVSAYRDVRERDLVGRQGRFIAEGEVVLRRLLAGSRFELESVFLSEPRHRALADILGESGPNIPVFVAPEKVMSAVVGFAIHRGVLAVGRRGEPPSAAGLLAACGPEALVVGLIGLANHDNVGGVFRNAAAFGVEAVILDQSCCDPLYRKAIRVSVGASLTLPFAHGGPAEAMLRGIEAAGFDVVALTPGGALPLAAFERRGRTALLLGAEGAGLPAAILARTQAVRIPMTAGFDSLNVATASGIALHHLTRVECATQSSRKLSSDLDDGVRDAISPRTV